MPCRSIFTNRCQSIITPHKPRWAIGSRFVTEIVGKMQLTSSLDGSIPNVTNSVELPPLKPEKNHTKPVFHHLVIAQHNPNIKQEPPPLLSYKCWFSSCKQYLGSAEHQHKCHHVGLLDHSAYSGLRLFTGIVCQQIIVTPPKAGDDAFPYLPLTFWEIPS